MSYLNIDNVNNVIEIPIMEDKDLTDLEVKGKCGICTLDNGEEIIGIIVEDRKNQYLILHELVHCLQMMNIPIINDCLNSICDEINTFDPDYSEYITGWVNTVYTDLYDTDIGVDYSTFVNREVQAYLIGDVWENDNGDINQFISIVEDLTGYEIVLLDGMV